MSITDELREYANKVIHREDYMAGLAFDLNRIADCIDAEHGASIIASGVKVVNDYVELPTDADGEPIHIGDVMDNTHKRGFAAKTVIGISYHEGDRLYVRVDEDELRWHDPLRLHHHHEPTVEDMLREFAMRTDQIPNDKSGIEPFSALVDEYAEKLREVVEHERD